jgi:metal-responsive CopG/Arc/MetJ family transcriptional regulator
MADQTVTQLIGITLPIEWVKTIDKHTGVLKNRQDIIRELIEPKILEWQKEA